MRTLSQLVVEGRSLLRGPLFPKTEASEIVHQRGDFSLAMPAGKGLEVGKGFSNEHWRVHRYSSSVELIDLANAGKRGKKVNRYVIGSTSYSPDKEELWGKLVSVYIMNALEADPKNGPMVAMDVFEDKYPKDLKIYKNELRGVDVAPGSMQPIVVQGKYVSITAKHDEFRILDKTDKANEPTCSSLDMKDAIKFYKWLQQNQDKVQDMRFSDLVTAMRDAKINYDRYCAVD